MSAKTSACHHPNPAEVQNLVDCYYRLADLSVSDTYGRTGFSLTEELRELRMFEARMRGRSHLGQIPANSVPVIGARRYA